MIYYNNAIIHNRYLEVILMKSVFYTAQEVAEILGVSRTKAYKIVKELNIELREKGYIIIAGKVPKELCRNN